MAGHHWVGARQAVKNTQVKVLVDNCGQDKQKIWYTNFEVDLGWSSNNGPVHKGGQHVYHVMAVHIDSTLQPAGSCSVLPSGFHGRGFQHLRLPLLQCESADRRIVAG